MSTHLIVLQGSQLPSFVHDLAQAAALQAGTVLILVATDQEHSDRLERAAELFEAGSFDFLGELPPPDSIISGSIITMALEVDYDDMMDAIERMMEMVDRKEADEESG